MPSATSRPVSAPLVVVCGLQAEAKIARADGVVLLVGGGDQRRLEADLARVASDSRAILSFGVAGGLASLLRPGDVRIAGTVVLPSGERVSADAGWSSELARRLDAPMATMVGADSPVADVASKAALNQSTGAELVDMESHIVARVASARGLPFAAVRVVTDAADRALPHAATVGMRADGRVDLEAILRSLKRNPGQLPALIRSGLDARTAFSALLRSRQRLGPTFALFDLG